MAQDNTAIDMSPTDPTAPPSNDATQQDAPPPSNQSIVAQIKSEKEKNGSLIGQIRAFFMILLGTCFMTLLMAVFIVIPITMIIIGAVYFDDCPAENVIPIYLITAGTGYIVMILIDLKARAQQSKLPPEEQADFKQNKVEGWISFIIGLFCLGFFIAGSAWIYGIDKSNITTFSSANDYCHPTLYYFAFWLTTVCYIILAIAWLVGSCIKCLACLGVNVKKKDTA